MDDAIIEFRNFSFRYDSQAEKTLYDINLKIRKGEKVLICGPSGCGKSTLSHCMNGLIPASYPGEASGDLIIGGKSFLDHTIFSLSRITGTVLQDSDGQFIGLTVGEDIAFALENDNTPLSEMKEKVMRAARRVGVEKFLSHAPHELSGGQKQRVSLAGVMVDDVSLFLFDEPLANLDPATGKTTIELIDQIQKTTDAAVVIIEHRIEDVLHRPVDRIVLMNDGRIAADMSPDELLSSPLLKECGIREPLYVTALKYAGVSVNADMHPGLIDTLTLSEADIERVRTWYENTLLPPEKEKGEVILEAENIAFHYDNGHEALKDVSLKVRKGEMISIVGRNGAGKSTFSKIICGFLKPQKGMLYLSGEDLSRLSIKERAERIGYVMQNPNQMLTKPMIRDEVALGLRLRGKLSEEEILKKTDEVLRICSLYEMRSWPVSALSYGQKKRVTIASILAMDPEIVILDEPTAGQDFRRYTEIMEFLRGLNSLGVTIILITHDMHLMLEYTRRAVVFTDGRVIADSDCEDILTSDTLTEKASLKRTSLSDLAELCALDGNGFVRRFIEHDRRVRA
ncbi:MAG: ABC transporter ATP-binding protein [Bullifex sp.]|nr:ABC transporter ATP-binding protein [Spirochaetales bacterium]MDY5777958.1 ABC transporter ATP-binding protein [Bullifex sp.]